MLGVDTSSSWSSSSSNLTPRRTGATTGEEGALLDSSSSSSVQENCELLSSFVFHEALHRLTPRIYVGIVTLVGRVVRDIWVVNLPHCFLGGMMSVILKRPGW